MATGSRYLVGIDLGTTNTACAYVDTRRGQEIEVFEIPQLVAAGRTEPRSTLPSFVYLAGGHELAPGSLDLPWAAGREFCTGVFARDQGARVSGRLVASAKSWLCHGGVDRTAAILPWGAADDVARISPVEASSRIVRHVVEAWDATFGAPLAAQDVVLTVPASFDAVARELTVDAARAAGLERVVLLEEPQAAFYAWLVAHERGWKEAVTRHPLVLVVDVGGGTTDLSLMAARHGRGELAIERVAVGDHVLLGGDNMDLALARRMEQQLGGTSLDASRFHVLVSQCREAKEAIFADAAVDEVPVTVPGRGRSVIGGALTARVTREAVMETVLEGFFPRVAADERPAPGTTVSELGLPLSSEPAITRHIADFLVRQRSAAGADAAALVRPDALLFNGGACEPTLVRERTAEVVGRWHDPSGAWRPAVVEVQSLQLAVARGAAYFGLVRRGRGVRIGSGTARTYYLGLDGAQAGEGAQTVLCLVPRGMEEGETATLGDREFSLTTNRPVAFPLFTATDRTGESAGQVLTVEPGALTTLPAIRTVLRFGRKLEERTLGVHLEARLTEIGTLEVWCRSRSTDHRWKLEFRLRDAAGPATPGHAADLVVDVARIEAASAVLREAFAGAADPVTLMRRLEEAMDAGRDAWPLAAIRPLFDVAFELEAHRATTPGHEARWLNVAGFLLRPGFGDSGDELRIGRLWRVLSQDLRHPKAVQGRAEWWNLWKRVAGGLSSAQQQYLLRQVSPALLRRGKLAGPKPGPQELREMWQAIGSCERLPAGTRTELAEVAATAAARGRATDQELWALARLGARAPIYGPINAVVPCAPATAIVERLLDAAWPRPGGYAFAVAQIARRTGDRERDLDDAVRARVARRLGETPGSERLARLVREVVELEAQEQARLLDESLPSGLRLAAP
jgi:molecular chaperone DnaK (HSP70)